MPQYDPTGHPLLSAEAKALDTDPAGSNDALGAYADAAELELGLAGTAHTGTDAQRARLAVVLWINCQLERAAGGRVQSQSKGNESVTYAIGKEPGEDPCARARALVADLGAGALAGAGRIAPVSRSIRNEYGW